MHPLSLSSEDDGEDDPDDKKELYTLTAPPRLLLDESTPMSLFFVWEDRPLG
jgi:hypothetical protein